MKKEDKHSNLYYLEDLDDYKVADSDKDVRGWIVRDSNGKKIGKVDNLIVNENTERVVYLSVEVDESIIAANIQPFTIKDYEDEIMDFINEEDENHIIIPIGMATLDEENEIVFTPKIEYDTFTETKRFRHGDTLYRDYEEDVYNSYTRPESDPIYPDDDTYYDNDDFNW